MPVLEKLRHALGLYGLEVSVREQRLALAIAEAKALRTLDGARITRKIEDTLAKAYENVAVPRFIEVFVSDDREAHWKIRETDDLDEIRGSFFIADKPIPDVRQAIRDVLHREAQPPKPRKSTAKGGVSPSPSNKSAGRSPKSVAASQTKKPPR